MRRLAPKGEAYRDFTRTPEGGMKKIKLDIEAVRVVSFATGCAAAVRGTAVARAADATPVCSGTTCILQCLTAQPRCF
jgi:hypothetical protein